MAQQIRHVAGGYVVDDRSVQREVVVRDEVSQASRAAAVRFGQFTQGVFG